MGRRFLGESDSTVAITQDQLLQIAGDHLVRKGIAVYKDYYTDDPDANVFAKVSITKMEVGLARIELANGKSYRYVPAFCLDGRFEIYGQDGKLLMDSSEMGLCRILEINLLDDSETCFSADGYFTFFQP